MTTLLLIVSLLLSGETADLSSPTAAARSLFEAVDRGDEAAIREILFAEDDRQREIAGAYATLVVSAKRLADAAQKRYGDSADAIARGALPDVEIQGLDAAVVKEAGDTATLQTPTMPRAMRLRRTDAGWKVLTEDPDIPPDRVAPQVSLTRDIAAAMSEVADEIAAGKYPAVQEAESAISQRINEAITRRVKTHPPSTQPTTQPE